MVVKTTQLPESIDPAPVNLVRGPESLFNMITTLKSGSGANLRIVCGNHTFNVHTVVTERKCSYFTAKSAHEGPWKITPTINLSEDDPTIIARLFFYLYTNSYPTTHIALTGVRDFKTLADYYIMQGRLELMHAAVYAASVKYDIDDLAETSSEAFRKLSKGVGQFLKDDSWVGIAMYIYGSTPDSDRKLRDIVIREIQYALRFDRSLIKSMDKLEVLMKQVPSLARDLALMPLSNTMMKCNKCGKKQYLLLLPCRHDERHEADDMECEIFNWSVQECFNCHKIGDFSEPWFK